MSTEIINTHRCIKVIFDSVQNVTQYRYSSYYNVLWCAVSNYLNLSHCTDLQMVNISLRVLFRPIADQLPQICRQLGQDYDDRVLPSICNEVRVSVHLFFFIQNLLYVMMICCITFKAGKIFSHGWSAGEGPSANITRRPSM